MIAFGQELAGGSSLICLACKPVPQNAALGSIERPLVKLYRSGTLTGMKPGDETGEPV
jgi:hypothetical protein